jgi:hypothetical protein
MAAWDGGHIEAGIVFEEIGQKTHAIVLLRSTLVAAVAEAG